MTAGPVSRILSAIAGVTVIPLRRPLLNACSDLPGTSSSCPEPDWVGASSRHAADLRPRSSPIWSCSVWGLPCVEHCCPAGGLLHHLFTLTAPSRMRRYVLCGTFRRLAFKPAARTLSGTLLCGVRTFLQPSLRTPRRAKNRAPGTPLRPASDRPVRLSTPSLYSMSGSTRRLSA